MTTTVLGRLLIHLRRTECRPHISRSSSPSSPYDDDDNDDDDDADEYDFRRRSRVISPFGLVPLNRKTSSGSAHSGGYWDGDADGAGGHARALSADNPLEITQIPLAYPYHYRKRAHYPRECRRVREGRVLVLTLHAQMYDHGIKLDCCTCP